MVQAGNAEARTARLAQIVYTVASVRGVRAVRIRVDGRAPPWPVPSLRPDAAGDQSRDRPAKGRLPEPPAPRLGPPSAKIRKLQQRLADLGYLLESHVDGRPGMETTFAGDRLPEWSGLGRDGVVGPATARALATAKRPEPIGAGTGTRIEVLLDRQSPCSIEGTRVVRTVGVSTGKGSNATPPGSFKVFRKEVKPGRIRSRCGCRGRATSSAGSRSTSTPTSRPRLLPTGAFASLSTTRSSSIASLPWGLPSG